MPNHDDGPQATTIIAPPAMAAASILFCFLMPDQLLVALMAWTLASLPVGILIGHCVLSEE